MTVQYMERVYDCYSGVYDFVFGKVFQGGRVMAPRLLALEPGTRLLETGAGTGLSIPLLPEHIEYTGVDLSERMLDRARRRVERLGRNHINLVKMDATNLEFPDNSFDRVLAAYFISVVPDPVRCVQEMMRVCKPGGYILFLNHFRSFNKFIARIDDALSPICYRLGFNMDLDLHKLMADTGLEIETLEHIDFRGQWKAVRCVNP
jgi:phosphatidylethanolamine/phosphatidyl-N-methylethanolamine N-methyltransferase